MKKPKLPRHELVLRLIDAFRSCGFEACTLSVLTKKTGLERASLYHHFPEGKMQMAEEVLDYILASLSNEVLKCFDTKEDSSVQYNNMLHAVKTFYNKGQDLCFISIFSMGGVSFSMKKKLSLAAKQWEQGLAKVLSQMEIEHAQKEARRILSTIQGSLILAHLHKRPQIFCESLDLLEKDFLNLK